MTPDEIKAAAREAVADWPDDYSSERKAELRRILLGATPIPTPGKHEREETDPQ